MKLRLGFVSNSSSSSSTYVRMEGKSFRVLEDIPRKYLDEVVKGDAELLMLENDDDDGGARVLTRINEDNMPAVAGMDRVKTEKAGFSFFVPLFATFNIETTSWQGDLPDDVTDDMLDGDGNYTTEDDARYSNESPYLAGREGRKAMAVVPDKEVEMNMEEWSISDVSDFNTDGRDEMLEFVRGKGLRAPERKSVVKEM